MATQLQLRNGTVAEWTTANPILAEAEMGIITDSKMFVIGDGKTKYIDLLQMPFGKGVYEVLVQYGYKGTREDFCRQLDLSLKNPEQQVGTFANAGPGWNSFTFPKEFSEDVYVTLTAQNAAVFGTLKNITRQGFHY